MIQKEMKMSKGALPLPYIVAIIFAVIVIAIIAYMFFTHTGIFTVTVDEGYCEAQKLQYCYDWQRTGTAPTWDDRCTGIGVPAPGEPACDALGIKIS